MQLAAHPFLNIRFDSSQKLIRVTFKGEHSLDSVIATCGWLHLILDIQQTKKAKQKTGQKDARDHVNGCILDLTGITAPEGAHPYPVKAFENRADLSGYQCPCALVIQSPYQAELAQLLLDEKAGKSPFVKLCSTMEQAVIFIEAQASDILN